MPTSEVIYEGELRTKATHIFSGTEIITDAPLDNQGKAEAFSPTDLIPANNYPCRIGASESSPWTSIRGFPPHLAGQSRTKIQRQGRRNRHLHTQAVTNPAFPNRTSHNSVHSHRRFRGAEERGNCASRMAGGALRSRRDRTQSSQGQDS